MARYIPPAAHHQNDAAQLASFSNMMGQLPQQGGGFPLALSHGGAYASQQASQGLSLFGSLGPNSLASLDASLGRAGSVYNLSIEEMEKLFRPSELGGAKSLGSMNMEDFLRNVVASDPVDPGAINPVDGMNAAAVQSANAAALQQRALGGKTVDEVWKHINTVRGRPEPVSSSGRER